MPAYIQMPNGHVPVMANAGLKIEAALCQYFGITLKELSRGSRVRRFCYPRQIGFYLFRNYTSESLAHIGSRFGSRDHTTVIHGINRIREMASIYPEVDNDITQLVSIIKQS